MRKWFFSPSNVAEDDTTSRDGSKSVTFTGAGYVAQIVFLETGFSYVPSTYALADSGGTPVMVFELYDYADFGDDDDGIPDVSGTPILTTAFDFTDKYDSWEDRHYANWDLPTDAQVLKAYTFVIRCTDFGNGVSIDDLMLNRGTSVPLPYQPHATDFFYREGLLASIDQGSTWITFRVPYDQVHNEDGTLYIEVFNEIDVSENLYVIKDDVDPVVVEAGADWGSYTQYQGSNVDPKAWRVLGKNRRIDLDSDPSDLVYVYYHPQSVLVLNGSLLAEGTITADKIFTNDLSSITADVGTLEAGKLNSSDYTDLGSVGSQINLTNGTFTFGGGGAGTHALEWNGTKLSMTGTIDQTISTSRTIFGGYDIGAGIVEDGQIHGYYDPGGGEQEIFTLGRKIGGSDYFCMTFDTDLLKGIYINGDNYGLSIVSDLSHAAKFQGKFGIQVTPKLVSDAVDKTTIGGIAGAGTIQTVYDTGNITSLFIEDSAAGLDLIYTNDKSLTTSGYSWLPGGLMMQWGTVTPTSIATGGTTVGITFPTSFPTACLNVDISISHTSGTPTVHSSIDTTSYTIGTCNAVLVAHTSAQTVGINYIAIGY